jgi:hypothetical protein
MVLTMRDSPRVNAKKGEHPMRRRIFITGLLVCSFGLCSAQAAVFHDESIQGDLSDDRLDPTRHTLALGTSSLLAGTAPFDLEYLTLTIPDGLALSQIVLADFTGDSFVSFIGAERGDIMSVTPAATTAAGLLGWAHFSAVGSDLLPIMGASGFGAEGFVPPLPAGTYAFWIQEIDAPVQYRLDFNVAAVPELSQWAMMSIGLMTLGALHTWKRRRTQARAAG